jgi:hypothetical protein
MDQKSQAGRAGYAALVRAAPGDDESSDRPQNHSQFRAD